MSDPRDDLTCPGCHSGDFADFDHYVDVNHILPDDVPIAFAAWMNGVSGGKWDGECGPVESPKGNP